MSELHSYCTRSYNILTYIALFVSKREDWRDPRGASGRQSARIVLTKAVSWWFRHWMASCVLFPPKYAVDGLDGDGVIGWSGVLIDGEGSGPTTGRVDQRLVERLDQLASADVLEILLDTPVYPPVPAANGQQ